MCESAEAARTAVAFLMASGYQASDIVHNAQVANFIYNASTHLGGSPVSHVNDHRTERWIVIGRRAWRVLASALRRSFRGAPALPRGGCAE